MQRAISKRTRLSLFFLMFALSGFARDGLIYDSFHVFTSLNSPDKIIKELRPSALHFDKNPSRQFNFGLVGSEYKYLVLKLTTPRAKDGSYLVIDNTSLDSVSIYRINNNGNNSLLYQGGELVAYNTNRKYVWHTAPLQITKHPSYYLIALKAAQKNINVKYYLLDKDVLQRNTRLMTGWFFFIWGLFV